MANEDKVMASIFFIAAIGIIFIVIGVGLWSGLAPALITAGVILAAVALFAFMVVTQ